MSDSDEHGPDVDDLLEAPYGAGNDKDVERDGKAGSAARNVQNGSGTSPEPPKNGRRSGSVEKKRRSRTPSSRSPSPKSSRKKRRSSSRDVRRRDRSDSRSRVRKSSREKSKSIRRQSPSDSDADRDRRRRRDKSRSRSPSRSPRSRSRERRREVRRRRDSRSPSPRRRSRSRSPRDRRDRYDGRRGDDNGYRGRGGGGGGGYRRSPPPFRGGGGYGGGYGGGRGGGRPRQSVERARSVRSESPTLPAEERDQRTVFAMQLAQTINAKDLEKFFSSVGKVRDVRLIVDSKTRRSKGIAYIEFYELEAVPLALGLHGQKLKNCPMIIQPTHAEKNRAAMAAAAGAVQKGPMRLYVGSLHFNITEDMLKDIFEPFGKIDSLQLMMDTETGRSRGYAFITFRDSADAKRAMEQLNGFELAGRAMKIGHVTDRSEAGGGAGGQSLDNDDMDRVGFDLGPTGRLQLMAKLAEGTGMKIPQATVQPVLAVTAPTTPMVPIATQCFMLSNMFDPSAETDPNWDKDLADEILVELSQYGGVLHVKVDKSSPEGHVYVKAVSISAASTAVSHLHGRFFAGKMITANYIPTMNYHQLFPEAMKSHQLLTPST